MINYYAIAFAILLAFLSNLLYDHKERKYKKDKTQEIPSRGEFRWVYRYLQISTPLTFTLALIFKEKVPGVIFQTPESVAIGLGIMTLGFAIFLAGKVKLGNHYSPCFDSFVPKDIVRDGIYKHIRHPIYTANIILVGGYFVASGHILILANVLILTAYYLDSARREEKALLQSFPSYNRYRETSGMFVPRLVTGNKDRAEHSENKAA